MKELVYRNTKEQWVECVTYAASKSRDEIKLDRPRIFLSAACAVVVLVTLFYGQWPISIVFGVLGLVLYFLYPMMLQRFIKYSLYKVARKRDVLPKDEVRIKIENDEFIVTVDGKTKAIGIDQIYSVNNIQECLFIQFKDKNQISLIIPVSVFESQQELDEFNKEIGF